MSLLDAHAPVTPAARHPLRYERVIALIEDIIAARGLQPGSLLPTQHELAKMAGVSLITVRRALQALEQAGKVAGHQGVGTFVARPRIVSDPARSGGLLGTFGEQAEPRQVETEVLQLRPGSPRPAVAHALRLPPGDLVWQLSRLRRIDGQPLIVEDALIPQRLAPDLGRQLGMLSGSLYELLARDHGLVDDHEEQYLEVITAGRARAAPARAAGQGQGGSAARRELHRPGGALRLLRAGLPRRRIRLLHLRPDGAPPVAACRPQRLGCDGRARTGVTSRHRFLREKVGTRCQHQPHRRRPRARRARVSRPAP